MMPGRKPWRLGWKHMMRMGQQKSPFEAGWKLRGLGVDPREDEGEKP